MRRLSLVVGLFLVWMAAAHARSSAADAAPQVQLTTGLLQGSLASGAPGAVFKAIPFARPPVGALRWHEPVPVQHWQGVRNATAFSPACAQIAHNTPTGSEDCLYLNVWTPQWPSRARHPVMLWLYGGANAAGSASNTNFDGGALARHGVVVVTANYRVGVMGFMAHPELSARSAHGSSGNYALLDQIMALRWIHENIAKFGGDAKRVTLFGQSSGAFDILSLMTSPLAKGLFSGAIAESGQILSFNGAMPKARSEHIGEMIAAELKAPEKTGTIDFLRTLPADQVMTAAAKFLPTEIGSDTGLLTTVDGWVLPQAPARVFLEGKEMSIPLIIGNNAREITPQLSSDQLREQISATYGDLAPNAMVAYGLADGGAGHSDPLLGGAAAQWMTDTVQRCAAMVEARWHAAAKNPTWEYQFERPLPGQEEVGAKHGAEVPFVFGNLDSVKPAPLEVSASDRETSKDIQEYWTHFAATGNPNSGSMPTWPHVGDGHYMAFRADGTKVKENLQRGPCEIFRQWTLRRLAQ